MTPPAVITDAPGELWGFLGLLAWLVAAEAGNRRQRKTKTEQIVATIQTTVAEVQDDIADVGRRLDEHIEATQGRIRDRAEPVQLDRRRRKDK